MREFGRKNKQRRDHLEIESLPEFEDNAERGLERQRVQMRTRLNWLRIGCKLWAFVITTIGPEPKRSTDLLDHLNSFNCGRSCATDILYHVYVNNKYLFMKLIEYSFLNLFLNISTEIDYLTNC